MTQFIFGGIIAGYFLRPYIDGFLKVLSNTWKEYTAAKPKPATKCMNEKKTIVTKPLEIVK